MKVLGVLSFLKNLIDTPIWMGVRASIAQIVIERLDKRIARVSELWEQKSEIEGLF